MHTRDNTLWSDRACISSALLGLLVASGCHIPMQARTAEFAPISYQIEQAVQRDSCDTVAALPATDATLAGEYSLQEYVAAALAQHPKIQAAKWAVDAAAWQVPVAASLEDPKLSITALPAPIETAAGRQNVIVGVSQKVPIREKQRRKEAIASAATEQSRAQLASAERDVAARVRTTYADLLFRQEALKILDDERELLREVTEIVVALYETDKVSQQDIAQAELAQLTVEQDIIVAQQSLRLAQTAMARLLHIAPNTELAARPEPCLERLSEDVEVLVRRAIASHPELHSLIAKANQDRMTASLAKLDYIPDPTFGASWVGIGNSGISPVANGNDAVLLNVSMNMPVYRKRIEAKIKSAEAKAISSTRHYDDARDEILRVVHDQYSTLQSKLELIELLRSAIIPKAQETLEVAVEAYSVSKVDVQQVLENWRKLVRLEMSMRELERDYRMSLATLERAVGTHLVTALDCQVTRLPEVGRGSTGSTDDAPVDAKQNDQLKRNNDQPKSNDELKQNDKSKQNDEAKRNDEPEASRENKSDASEQEALPAGNGTESRQSRTFFDLVR